MKSIGLFLLVLASQLFLAGSASADARELGAGVFFCGDCMFFKDEGNKVPPGGEVMAFIKGTVNPKLGFKNWESIKFVTICNSSSCVVIGYNFGTHVVIGADFPNVFPRDIYKNPEDLPPEVADGDGGDGYYGPTDPNDYGSPNPYSNCFVRPGYRYGTSTGGGPTVWVTVPSTLSCEQT